MQDPTFSSALAGMPQFPEQEQQQHLKCPRCESTNTKFCYYNNYNLSQPRHFCKNCRRYWTKGGALRNVPVGGGTRKNSKRTAAAAAAISPSDAPSSSSPPANTPTAPNTKRPNPTPATTTAPSLPSPAPTELTKIGALPGLFSHSASANLMIDMGGSLSSLLTSNGHLGSLLESFHHAGHSVLSLPTSRDLSRPTGAGVEALNAGGIAEPIPCAMPENFLGWGGSGGGGNGTGGGGGGWPNLSIYTPGSSFQ